MGEDLRIDGAPGEGEILLRLVEVDRIPPRPGAPRAEPFALLFAGPVSPVLDQRMYSLHHPDLGSIELFLVPVGPGPDGRMRYESVFN